MSLACIFLDRDGVLNVDLGYTYKVDDLRLVHGAVPGLKKLHAQGYVFVIVTNQAGVARGFYGLDEVKKFNDTLISEIQRIAPEIQFLDVMVCPHHPKGSVAEYTTNCLCRKPGTKLIDDAVKKHGIDLKQSWLVGDKDSDIDCAHNAGMRAIQVTGGGKQYDHHPSPFAKVENLNQAADIIVSLPR